MVIPGGWRLTFGAAIVAACVVAPVTAHAEAACAWALTDLPVPAGTSIDDVSGGDPSGRWVVGTGRVGGKDAAVVWRDGVARQLRLQEGDSIANDVNAHGVALEYSYDRKASYRHFPDGRVEQLPALAGTTGTFAVGINAAGEVLGRSGEAVVVWPASGEPRVVAGADSWFPVLFGEDGTVVAKRVDRGSVWNSAGDRVELTPMAGHRTVDPVAFSNGRIVGYSSAGFDSPRTVVEWDVKGNIARTFTDLSDVADINASGDVLAASADRSRQVVRRTQGIPQALPGSIWGKVLADSGDVYGTRWKDSGYAPFRLTCG